MHILKLGLFLLAILVDVVELYVLVFLGYYLCLNFPCSIGCTTDQNKNRRASESTEGCEMRDLFDYCRTGSKDGQKCRP